MKKIVKINKIKKFIRDNNLTLNEFCYLCDISPLLLNKIFEGFVNFKTIVLF